MNITYLFPTQFTFWTTLWYIFLFYLVAFIVFNIYIWANGLQYEINCKNKGKCVKITKKMDKDIEKDSI